MAFYGDEKHNENMEHVSPTTKEFVFNLDQKVTTWMRTEFTIEAENLTEAKELAIKFHLDGETEEIEWTQIEGCYEKLENDENGGECTEEIYFNGLLVYTNDL
jgi:hypothetical protein